MRQLVRNSDDVDGRRTAKLELRLETEDGPWQEADVADGDTRDDALSQHCQLLLQSLKAL